MATSVSSAVRPVGEGTGPSTSRRVYLDNLKVVLVAGVIIGHAFITYADVGSWKYNEPSTNDFFNIVAGLAVSVGALFAMGLFFLIAGWLTPRSCSRKGPVRFAADRLVRLGLPLLAYVLVIYPFLGWLGDGMEGSVLSAIRREIPKLDPGPLWFVAALLIFSLAYASLRLIRPAPLTPVPLRPGLLLGLGAIIATTTFAIRLQFPIDSRQFLMLHVWQWPQCLGLFALGLLAAERGWLDPVPAGIRKAAGRWAIAGVLAIVAAFAASSDSLDPFSGGLTWQALVVAVAEGVISVSLAVWLLARFRERHHTAGRVAQAAGRAAFGAYVLQAPVLVGMAVALEDVGVTPEVKFLFVAPIGLAISFALAWLLTLIPGVRRVL